MKGGGKIYPNKGVKIDPRAITSANMPESLKVYSGYLDRGYKYLLRKGIMTWKDIERENQRIKALLPLSENNNKLEASLLVFHDNHLIEFLRTSNYNYKIYVLRLMFSEVTHSFFRDRENHK